MEKLLEPAQSCLNLPAVGVQRRGRDYGTGTDFLEETGRQGDLPTRQVLIVHSKQHLKPWLREGQSCGQGHKAKKQIAVCPCGCTPGSGSQTRLGRMAMNLEVC